MCGVYVYVMLELGIRLTYVYLNVYSNLFGNECFIYSVCMVQRI